MGHLFTIGKLAEHFNQPHHRINYVLRSRGIEPTGIIGILRVYDDVAVELIAKALKEVEANRR